MILRPSAIVFIVATFSTVIVLGCVIDAHDPSHDIPLVSQRDRVSEVVSLTNGWGLSQPAPYLVLNCEHLVPHPGDTVSFGVGVFNPTTASIRLQSDTLTLELRVLDSSGHSWDVPALSLPTRLEGEIPPDDDRFWYSASIFLPDTIAAGTLQVFSRVIAGDVVIRPRAHLFLTVYPRDTGEILRFDTTTVSLLSRTGSLFLEMQSNVRNQFSYPVEYVTESVEGVDERGSVTLLTSGRWRMGVSIGRLILSPGQTSRPSVRLLAVRDTTSIIAGMTRCSAVRLSVSTNEGESFSEWYALDEPLWLETTGPSPFRIRLIPER